MTAAPVFADKKAYKWNIPLESVMIVRDDNGRKWMLAHQISVFPPVTPVVYEYLASDGERKKIKRACIRDVADEVYWLWQQGKLVEQDIPAPPPN